MPTGTESATDWEALLDEARARLRLEQRRAVDEREAFRAFRLRVDSIEAESVRPVRRDGGAIGEVSSPAPGSGLVRVRDAYEETVMSVPHYEAEYDDTYERSVAVEFGPELGYALTRTARFHAEYKGSLLAAVDTATEERESLVNAVRSEGDSIERVRSRLAPIADEVDSTAERTHADAGFGALDAYRTRAQVLLDDCDRIAARRQRELADRERELALGEELDLPTYLYRELPVTYPALMAVGAVGDQLHELTRRVERAMADAA